MTFTCRFVFFFFNDTATTEIYTLSLHDALPILHLSTFLFDLDGTLIDSIELILRSYRHTMRLHRGQEPSDDVWMRSEEHTSELQSRLHLVCRLLLEKKKIS